MKRKFVTTTLVAIFFIGSQGFAQSDEAVITTILQNDGLFWKAYNTCDTATMGRFLERDVEFYHDKGGPSFSADTLLLQIKRNLCSNSNFRLRREAVSGTVQVFPLHKANVVYGAVISGQHLFYIIEPGKGEQLDGLASFTHLWLLKNGAWRMARILSYDHGPAARLKK